MIAGSADRKLGPAILLLLPVALISVYAIAATGESSVDQPQPIGVTGR
jgi:hypothetical protein